ncbi:hypothetical protein [Ignavibacterium album]|uniref:hypothetical protein n=1 Tax=Ignavibacterium album TaxID=591197 RepID=UPI0035BA5D7B
MMYYETPIDEPVYPISTAAKLLNISVHYVTQQNSQVKTGGKVTAPKKKKREGC